MITFFTIPKPFKGQYNIIQRNAIASWKLLKPECEIVLFGNDESIVKFGEENNITVISDFSSNGYGTPLLDDIYSTIEKIASNNLVCFINTDIILFNDFLSNISSITLDEYLIAGRRWDLDVDELIDFSGDWEAGLIDKIKTNGTLHPNTGSDFFLFPKKLIPNMPAFAIGRGWWDNWLFFYFKKRGIPIIDGTKILTLHQNHDYTHIKSVTKTTTFKGIERIHNQKISKLKVWENLNIADADYFLSDAHLVRSSFKARVSRIIFRYIYQPLSYFLRS